MARDVGLEKAKVQELKSRLTEVYPSVDSLLQYLAPGEHNGEHLSDEGVNGHLLLENHRQRELIIGLESSLREHEEAIRELKSRLEEMVQELRMSYGQHKPDRLSPDKMTGGRSEELSVEIITGNPSFIEY
jgi:hypothetical protein